MKKKLLIAAFSILVIINISAFATLTYHRYCRNHENCSHDGKHSGEKFLCQELSLSDSQIKMMRQLTRAFHSQADSISLKLHQKRIALTDLLAASTVDTAKINESLKEIDALQAELQKHVIYYLLKEKETLNSEQQEKFISLIKQRLLRTSRYYRTSGIGFIEDDCNKNCQKLNNCPNNSK